MEPSVPKLESIYNVSGRTPGVWYSKVKDLDFNTFHPGRGGVIVYTHTPGTPLRVCLGLDAIYHQLTDFGGGILYETDGDAVNGALREFQEESLGVFGPLTREDVQESVAVYNHKTLIILHPLEEIDPYLASSIFASRAQSLERPEVSKLVWLPLEKLLRELDHDNGVIYSRVWRLLRAYKGLFLRDYGSRRPGVPGKYGWYRRPGKSFYNAWGTFQNPLDNTAAWAHFRKHRTSSGSSNNWRAPGFRRRTERSERGEHNEDGVSQENPEEEPEVGTSGG